MILGFLDIYILLLKCFQECCRGDIVIKQESQVVGTLTTTEASTSMTPTSPPRTTSGPPSTTKAATTTSKPSSTVSEVCLTGWTFFEHTGQCYKHLSNKTIQADALSSCKHSLGGLDEQTVHLVSIPDKITNDFLTTVTREESWTGGYQDDSETWYWSDGSTWTGYNNWKSGQPDNYDWRNHAWGGFEDYLGINFEGVGNWNDYPPLYLMGSLCQYNPTPQFSS